VIPGIAHSVAGEAMVMGTEMAPRVETGMGTETALETETETETGPATETETETAPETETETEMEMETETEMATARHASTSAPETGTVMETVGKRAVTRSTCCSSSMIPRPCTRSRTS
jgi:hypothetical protein